MSKKLLPYQKTFTTFAMLNYMMVFHSDERL